MPSHTETLHDLGVADAVVGRTRFCIHPAAWVETLPHVGGTKDADLDKILALQPDLVVADKDENPKALVDDLVDAGVAVVWSDIDHLDDTAAWLTRLGDVVGAPDAAARYLHDLDAARRDVAAARSSGTSVPVWCPIWYEPWMTFNGTAYPSAVLAELALRNVFARRTGDKYFPVEAAEVAAAGAHWTLLPTEPYPFHKRRDAVVLEGLGAAGDDGRVLVIDGEDLTWFGSRAAAALQRLAAATRHLHD